MLEPGSTFKILTLAKAIDAGKTTMHSYIQCGGELHPGPAWRIRCDAHHGNRAHGPVDPTKAIAKSCNVAAATWALRVGRAPFVEYMESLGLFRRSRIGLPRETWGSYNNEKWARPLALANFGFGQSMSITPIALAGAFSTIANDGVRRPLRLIGKIGDRETPLGEGERILSAEACRETRACMEAVIETDGGTGKTLRIPGYRLAGKTGTAQKIAKGEHGYVASFIGFVPARKPQAVVLVMINKPQGEAYYGAQVAGPVFKALAQGVIERYRIKPDAQAEREGTPAGPAVDLSATPVAMGPRRYPNAG
ncbi:penicillin-binding protein 2 [bacterium]|nr:MAG: penicillin-binding protein 2 [bacterium]